MSTKYKIRDQTSLYFITFAVVNWVDVFTRQQYRDIFIESLTFCQKEKGLQLHAYVVMSNHVHLIIGTTGQNKVEDILRDLKKYTSVQIIKAIKTNRSESRRDWMLWLFKSAGEKNTNNKNYQFWRQDNHPIVLDSNEILEQKLEYIHDNPVHAGKVLSPEEYLYSSAKNYYGFGEYLLEIELIS